MDDKLDRILGELGELRANVDRRFASVDDRFVAMDDRMARFEATAVS